MYVELEEAGYIGFDFWDVFSFLFEYMGEDSEFLAGTIKDILIGIGMAALGTWGLLIRTHREETGSGSIVNLKQ